MGSKLANISVLYVLIILVQVFLLNNIGLFHNNMLPFLYVLVLLSLPFETPNWLLLVIGLITGLIIDVFDGTLGMHASACVFMMFLRPYVLKYIAPRDGYEYGMEPILQVMGLQWFGIYASTLVFAHHIWLFYVEFFKFEYFFSTLFRAILSSGFTFVLIIIVQYLMFKPKSSKF